MLDNIKSTYFINIVFRSIDEGRKLDIIKYNKRIQNNMNIDIINYKIFSGRYILYGTNKKGKEYNSYNDILIYEGEYLNGKRHGKGKEYDKDGNIIFEGEYLNAKKWNGKGNDDKYELKNGKGVIIEYDQLNNIKYEGEFLNGKRHGKGKEDFFVLIGKYNGEYLNGYRHGYGIESKCHSLFVGEYLYGKKWNGNGKIHDRPYSFEIKNGKGYVREYYDYNSNFIFEGEYSNGQRNGIGKIYHFNHLMYIGEFKNGELNGEVKGYDSYNNLIFEGIFLYSQKRKGKQYKNKYLEYEGEYLYDKKWNGKGYDENDNIIYELNNGNGKVKEYNKFNELIYEGGYLNQKRNGKGKEYYGGYIYEGEFNNNIIIGYGKIHFYGGNKYEGEINNKIMVGYGIYYFKNGDRYEGKFNNNIMNGYGIYYFKNGDRYEGEFDNIKKEGYGIIYLTNGDRYEGQIKYNNLEINVLAYIIDKYEGEFNNNIMMNGYGTYYFKNGGKYEGEFNNNKFEGNGIEYFFGGGRYEGGYKNDRKEGYGIIYFDNGDIYEGTFRDGICDGYGIFYSSLGFEYKGHFKKDLSTSILFIFYKILLILNYLYSKIVKNKMTLFLLIILIFGILIN